MIAKTTGVVSGTPTGEGFGTTIHIGAILTATDSLGREAVYNGVWNRVNSGLPDI